MLIQKMLITKKSMNITLKVNWLKVKTFWKNKKELFQVLQKRKAARVHTIRRSNGLRSTVETTESKLTLPKEAKATSLNFLKSQV